MRDQSSRRNPLSPGDLTVEASAASSEDDPLERQLNALLARHPGVTVSTAESCTGGLVASRITSIPGSSDYFVGGIVSYSNGAKHALLGVSNELLETRGAVSDECARAMAEGSLRAFGSDVAVSTTGIAGPGGATPRKPVGLVYIATAGEHGTVCAEHHFPGDRAEVTAAAAEHALKQLFAYLERSFGTEPPFPS